MTATTTRRTELAHRTSDGIDVHLFWTRPGDRVTVSVFDERTNESFELEVDGREALDAFHHPYAMRADPTPFAGSPPNTNRLEDDMHGRIDNPAVTVPGALQALQGVANAARGAGIPDTTLSLVELRASQINGCGVCVDIHSRELALAGEPAERINTVAVWRDVSYFTDAERAALALTEAATRLADRPDPVPDDVWDEAARHYDKEQLAALVLEIASINAWNRLNVTTRQVGGDWVGQWLAASQANSKAA